MSLLQAKDEPGLRQHLGNDAHPGDSAERITAYGGTGWTLSEVSRSALIPRAYALSAMVHSVCLRVHRRLDLATFSSSGDSGLAPALPRPAWLTWIWLLEPLT
ncbi:hypothetical protein [Micromonospora arida]|uniref:Uncharacterized protein n=1 Tax=Micromonospora arida TaxID=2203715 RepID=A0A3N9X5P8_9ACTN|nr:hypothetical protein [Micromonospora arida]RQX08341.1 hypothetical protein DLJ58_18630 [Micromonospora arida]